MAAKKAGLGRGFNSLFSENSLDGNDTTELRLSQIEPNRSQPRKVFDEIALQELADSISKHGLIQPLLVRPLTSGNYQIVAGERRWRASRLAGLDKIPVIIKELDDNAAAEIALIENLQREDLNPVEEALGYKHLMDTYGMTQEQIAESVGKSRSAIANALRLLGLSESELQALSDGKITSGHARALLSIEDNELRNSALEMSVGGASVREIEKYSKAAKTANGNNGTSLQKKNKVYAEVEAALALEIGRKVSITGNGKSGTLKIDFFDNDDLFDLAKKIAGEKNG